MPHRDSIDKIVTSYFACVTAEEFTYKDQTFVPKVLKVSPYLFRGFTCPAHCAACCPRFSLDFLPESKEKHPYELERRIVRFNGYKIPIYSDTQEDHDNHHCRNVRKSDGRCGIHGVHPFSCDFELIRFMCFADDEAKLAAGFAGLEVASKPNVLTQKLYGRGHAMLRIDHKTRGTLCEMTPPNPDTVADVIRKLKRLKTWCEHFKLKHKVDTIIAWAEDRGGRARVDPLFV